MKKFGHRQAAKKTFAVKKDLPKSKMLPKM
jgi:hypothetical protein